MRPEITSTARPSTIRVWSFLGLTLGGTLLALGALLPWAAIRPFTDAQTRGVDLTEGTIALIAGVCVLIAMLLMRVMASSPARTWLAAAVLVVSLAAAALALSYALTSHDRDMRAGVWLVVAGGVVGAGGAVASIAWARAADQSRATATRGPGTSNGSPPQRP